MKKTMAVVGVSLLAACSQPYRGGGGVPSWVSETDSFMPGSAPVSPLVEKYSPVATKIIAAARGSDAAYAKLVHLTDRIGARLSGSAALDQAIAWAVEAMKRDGLEARTEDVMVPHWVRGAEDVAIVAPVERPLRVLALGGSVPTPKGGIVAPVVVVRSWDELEKRAADIKGAIVLYDVAMPAWSDETGSGYGQVAPYRSRGASRAAKHGAVGMLMRSVTANSLRTPHTGALSYDPQQPKIPAAAVTVEDAMYIARLAAKGPVKIRMRLESQQLPDAKSANVIGELRGSEKPDEIVLIGAHIDSWDVGQGAHDDGAGCVIVMQALAVLKDLGLKPRRTIRVVLFTNEENGLRGARAYAEQHKAELGKHVLAVEADFGGFAPGGLSIELDDPRKESHGPKVRERIAEIATLIRPVADMHISLGGSGADLIPLVPAGIPSIGFWTMGRTYFDIHHTEADTLDKVDPKHIADNVAAMAVLAYVVADLPERVDAP